MPPKKNKKGKAADDDWPEDNSPVGDNQKSGTQVEPAGKKGKKSRKKNIDDELLHSSEDEKEEATVETKIPIEHHEDKPVEKSKVKTRGTAQKPPIDQTTDNQPTTKSQKGGKPTVESSDDESHHEAKIIHEKQMQTGHGKAGKTISKKEARRLADLAKAGKTDSHSEPVKSAPKSKAKKALDTKEKSESEGEEEEEKGADREKAVAAPKQKMDSRSGAGHVQEESEEDIKVAHIAKKGKKPKKKKIAESEDSEESADEEKIKNNLVKEKSKAPGKQKKAHVKFEDESAEEEEIPPPVAKGKPQNIFAALGQSESEQEEEEEEEVEKITKKIAKVSIEAKTAPISGEKESKAEKKVLAKAPEPSKPVSFSVI